MKLAVQRAVEEDAQEALPEGQRVGVVFVHGVGSQTQSATVLEYARPLVDWLREWHRRRPNIRGFKVASSLLYFGQDVDEPPRAIVHIPAPDAEHKGQTWVLTEAWWAPRLTAPNFGKMVAWCSKVLWRAVDRLIAAVDPPALVRGRGPVRLLVRVADAVLSLLFFVGAVLGFLLLLLLTLVAQLPIPALERLIFVRLLRPLLLDFLGDFYVFLYDEVQALNMRRAVTGAVEWLVNDRQCERVVVVAHSGGALLAYDALGSRGAPGTCVHETPSLSCVDGLLTFGAALNNARQDGFGPKNPLRLQDPLCEHTTWVDAWSMRDPVSGGALAGRPAPNESIEVTNAMNVITDHGGYFTNREEFYPLLAQLIESPGDRQKSRFWNGGGAGAWVHQRQDRVAAVVAWRLAAGITFGSAVLVRAWAGLLERDGQLLLNTAASIPIAGDAVEFAGSIFAASPSWLQSATTVAVAVAFWSAVSTVLYLVVTRPAYDRWADRRGTLSVGPDGPSSQAWAIALRTVAAVAGFLALAVVVAFVGPVDPGFAGWIALLGILVVWLLFWNWLEDRLDKATADQVGAPVPGFAAQQSI